MNTYRSAAVALTACAAGLSLTACTAGTTTASTAATSPAARSSASASASALASVSQAGPALASRTIKVSGEFGFPIPARAKVVENVASDPGAIVFFDQVTPAKVSSFYAQALPRAGYTITVNSVISQSGGTVAFIQFTGHGVKGTIDALSKFTDSSVSIAGLGHKNVTTISIRPK